MNSVRALLRAGLGHGGGGAVRGRGARGLRLGGGRLSARAPRLRPGLAAGRPGCGRVAVPGVPSCLSSLGWDPGGAAHPLSLSSRPSNLNHAGS